MSDVAQAAVVSGCFAVIVIVVQALVARMNSQQHGMVDTKIDTLIEDAKSAAKESRRLREDIGAVADRLDDHKVIETKHHEENIVRLELIDGRVSRVEGRVTALEPKEQT